MYNPTKSIVRFCDSFFVLCYLSCVILCCDSGHCEGAGSDNGDCRNPRDPSGALG